jgi:hypothetical protein
MNARRRQRIFGRDGLWQDTPEAPYVPAENLQPEGTTPFLRRCPACHAAPRQPCTRPGRGGRKALRGYHDSRCTPPDQEKP